MSSKNSCYDESSFEKESPPPYYPEPLHDIEKPYYSNILIYDIEKKPKAEEGQGESDYTDRLRHVQRTGVKICPHDRLSSSGLLWWREKYIENNEGILPISTDALSHQKAETHNDRQCYLQRTPQERYGEYESKWRYARADENGYPGPGPGIVAVQRRTYWLDRFPKDIATEDSLKPYLDHGPVKICPHNSLLGFLKSERVLLALDAVRGTPIVDPLEIRRIEENLNGRRECKWCHSTFKCRLDVRKKWLTVKTVAFMGRAKSARDPGWLYQ
ncbi:MAG: hypothetical protein Q9216_000373 [Gyalolechia sp. 2 TL-2023]